MYCPHCGSEVNPEAVFCHRCGERIDAEQVGPAPDAESARMASNPSSGNPAPPENASRLRPTNRTDDPEAPIWEGSVSPKAFIPAAVGAAVLSIVLLIGGAFLPLDGRGWTVLVGLVVLICLFVVGRWAWQRLDVYYVLTTQRFIHRHGILRRVTDRIEVIDVDDVAYRQGIIERLLGIGTIQVTSSDRSHPTLNLAGIDNVAQVADQIDRARRTERVRRGLHIESV